MSLSKVTIDQFSFTIKPPSYMDQALILQSYATKRASPEEDFTYRLATTHLLFKTTIKSMYRDGVLVPLTFSQNGDLTLESLDLVIELTGAALLERLGTACIELMCNPNATSITNAKGQVLEGISIHRLSALN